MVKCSLCERPAVYINPISKLAYCKKHFVEYFEHRVRKTLRKYGMLREEEHIVVATSGGKDSMSLLHILVKLTRKNPKWKLTAVLVDEGIRNYREKTVENLLKYVETRGVNYVVASFRDYVGMDLDKIVLEGRERGLPYMPCSYCGVFRRYVLNTVAREIGATVIATAHNMDDVVQTYLMNIISNSWDRVSTLAPIREAESGEFIRRIKPFYEIPEKETALYALLNNLVKPEFIQCPYVKYNVRFTVRRLLNELEDKYPGTKYGLLRSLQSIIPVLREYSKNKTRYKCIICGNSSSKKICRACIYKAQLGLLETGKINIILDLIKEDRGLTEFLKYFKRINNVEM